MAIVAEENDKVIIRTLECDLCLRFDSIILDQEELLERTNTNKLQIGSYIISHHDHVRIIYFDNQGSYLGDTISLNLEEMDAPTFESTIPIFPKEVQGNTFGIIRKMLLHFVKNKLAISILGPSFAGKTSLVRYLETGVPERYLKVSRPAVTMGKSLKRFTLGKSKLSVYDMGGQKNFWDSWKASIDTSDCLIFVLDGTSPKNSETIDALTLVLESRQENQPILILINKMDLYTEGYTNRFIEISDVQSKLKHPNVQNIWWLQTSIFNGICYNYQGVQEEIPLLKVINEYLNVSVV